MSGIIAQNSGRHTGLVKASSGGGGVWNLIETQTASGDSTLDFTSGIDSTYDEYSFRWTNIHASADDVIFTFQADTGTNTSYNQTMTTTFFAARHGEGDSPADLTYIANRDQAQATGFQKLNYDTGNQTTDENLSGVLHLFSPSNTTFVKHFISRCVDSGYTSTGTADDNFVAGYFNTTTAITRFQFKMTSGNIDAGQISLYGIT